MDHVSTCLGNRISEGTSINDVIFQCRWEGQIKNEFQAFMAKQMIKVSKQVNNSTKSSDIVYGCSLRQNGSVWQNTIAAIDKT